MRPVEWGPVALVAVGGAIGSALRFLIGVAAEPSVLGVPWATLGINVGGSFLLGVVLGALPPDHTGRLLLGLGFCGGFTTFSTFSAETLSLITGRAYGRASLYVTASVLLGLLATACGAALGRAAAGEALRG